jgi:hypothetical protein
MSLEKELSKITTPGRILLWVQAIWSVIMSVILLTVFGGLIILLFFGGR